MEQIRSFIAITLPQDIKDKLNQLEIRLKAESQLPVKWVEPGNIHLTLKFLGNINSEFVDKITRAMENAASTIKPFCLEIKDLGVFPNPKRPQIAWVGISGEINELSKLHKHLEDNLSSLGFTPESRPFAPHLTLARVRNQATSDERHKLGQIIDSREFNAGSMSVDTINLMKSELTRQGAIYTRINSTELKKTL